jgi:hypothetical protein
MAGCVVHLRLPQHVLAQLDALCGAMQQTRSAAIRQSVQYVLAHPELWPELLARHAPTTVEDLRTPEQVTAWERDGTMLTRGADLSPLLRSKLVRSCPPPPLHSIVIGGGGRRVTSPCEQLQLSHARTARELSHIVSPHVMEHSMSRWSTLRRTVAPRSTQSERKPPPDTRAFTPDEVRTQRLELAQDMLRLVLRDGGPILPAPVQHDLQMLYKGLEKARRRARTLS